MDISSIRTLVGEANPDLFKTLTFGHLRGLQDGELYELIHEHTFEVPLGTWIFRCFLDKACVELKDTLARDWLDPFSTLKITNLFNGSLSILISFLISVHSLASVLLLQLCCDLKSVLAENTHTQKDWKMLVRIWRS